MIFRRRIGNWLGCMAVLGWSLAFAPARSVAAPSPLGSLGISGRPLRGYKICVDPGHGGQSARDSRYTGGTFGVSTRQTESDVNLRVGLMLAQFLEEAGASVVLTRTTDNRVQDKADMASELDARVRFANSRRADLYISMHHNDGPRGVNYTAVFYHRNSPVSAKLADQISASLAFGLGTPNIGSRSSAYRVLRDLKMPGVIVECSFMTNASEDARLANLAYNKLQAKGVAVGIINYVRQTKGRGVDFSTVFGPLDTLGNRTQVMADSTYRGDGPPPSAPFFGRRNSTPADDAALALATASPAPGMPTDGEVESANTALSADAGAASDPGMEPLTAGSGTRLEALRQSAANSGSSNSRKKPTAKPSTSSARSRSTASASASNKKPSTSNYNKPSSSSRANASSSGANRNKPTASTPGRVVARTPGAAGGGSSASRPVTNRAGTTAANRSSTVRKPTSASSSRSSSSGSTPKPRTGNASVSYSRRQ